MSACEMAKLLNVSVDQVHRLRKAGILSAVRRRPSRGVAWDFDESARPSMDQILKLKMRSMVHGS